MVIVKSAVQLALLSKEYNRVHVHLILSNDVHTYVSHIANLSQLLLSCTDAI